MELELENSCFTGIIGIQKLRSTSSQVVFKLCPRSFLTSELRLCIYFSDRFLFVFLNIEHFWRNFKLFIQSFICLYNPKGSAPPILFFPLTYSLLLASYYNLKKSLTKRTRIGRFICLFRKHGMLPSS